MQHYRIHSQKRVEIQAMLFSILFFGVLVASIVTAFASSGPIVLGTEMNANGMVEYLCLGDACESFTSFKWSDK